MNLTPKQMDALAEFHAAGGRIPQPILDLLAKMPDSEAGEVFDYCVNPANFDRMHALMGTSKRQAETVLNEIKADMEQRGPVQDTDKYIEDRKARMAAIPPSIRRAMRR